MKRATNRACSYCKSQFVPSPPGAKVCSIDCAISLADKKRSKIVRADIKAQREKLKSRKEWLKEAQLCRNKRVRYRDRAEPCISCQRFHKGQIHAGHYISVGACSSLRFDLANIHAQCKPCNTDLHGNPIKYRKNLVDLIGQDEVDRLEGPQEIQHFSIDYLKAQIAEDKAAVKLYILEAK